MHSIDQIKIMGVLNVTPDSFSDGGDFTDLKTAVDHALKMVRDGADIIDIGGESSRPGSKAVTAEVEIQRVIPVITEIRRHTDIPISIDTTKSVVAAAALDVGANIVNDISAGNFDPEMIPLVAKRGMPIILMHMKGTPKSMQVDVHYDDLWGEIITYLQRAIRSCEDGGIASENIIVDPGIGFGKLLEHNLEIIRNLDKLKVLGKTILLGPSRKAFIGKLLGDAPSSERLEGTLAAVAVGVTKGASIIRVHDVKETRRFLKVYGAIL